MSDDIMPEITGPLSMYVPEPPTRPGDAPDFSYIDVPKAGAVKCPPVNTKPDDMRDLAYSIVRVLSRKGDAVGPWADYLGDDLNDESLLRGLKDMMKTRVFDARMLTAQRQGKTSFYTSAWAKKRSQPVFSA